MTGVGGERGSGHAAVRVGHRLMCQVCRVRYPCLIAQQLLKEKIIGNQH